MATAISMLREVASSNVHAMHSTSSNGSSSDTSSSAATITSNDFLTLLVTEMKNQDPTSTMDPNEYINQLVNVNSLQQLVSINQTLGNALGGSTAASATGSASIPVAKPSSQANSAIQAASTHRPIPAVPVSSRGHAIGNFTIPPTNSNAQAVAEAFTVSGIAHK